MPCIKLSSGKTVCYGEDTNKYPDGGPVNKNKPIVDKGVDINAKPWMKDNDSWFENIVEFVDPTGISSWDDVRRARNNYGPGSSEAMIEMAGAIPFLGKIGKSGKIITGGFGLLQDVVKGSKYLPSGAQKKVLDKTYDLYQKYAKSGGKELDEILGSGSKLIRDNVPLLNPSLHASSAPVINSFNFLQKLGRGKTAYDAATGSKDDSGFKGGFGSNEPLQYDGRNVFPDLSSEYSYSQGGTIFFNHQPVRFPDGGEVDLKLNRVPKPVEDDFDMSGGFQGNLFHNVGARGELKYGPLNMSGQAMLSGYDKGWNPNVSSNLSTNVQVNPKLNVSGNLNYNYNKGEGSQFSPTIGASYQANPNLNIGGSFTPGSNSASFSIKKKFRDGGETLQVQGSNFNFPVSKERQLAEQARMQGDMPVAPGIVKAKEKLREQEAVEKKLSNLPTVKFDDATQKQIDAQGLKRDLLTEMMLRNQQSLSNPDDRSIEADIAQDLQENGAMGLIDAPIKGATALLTGRYQTPSQAIGRWANQNNHQMLRNAMIDDQFNPTGLGMVTDWGGPIGLEQAVAKGIGAVRNIPGLNPSKFKSEIDWAKWNPETPKYKELIDEYNQIEKSTKKAGTWMKNPDGSPFQGTPEQFIQQQSSHFKKAFPEYHGEILNHNTSAEFNIIDESVFNSATGDGGYYGKGTYTHPSKKYTKPYGKNNYEFYLNSENKGFLDKSNIADAEYYKRSNDEILQYHLPEYENKLMNYELNPNSYYDNAKEIWLNKLNEQVKAGKISRDKLDEFTSLHNPQNGEVVIPFNNRVKSAVGNVGFFDMSNPNIYKSLVPAMVIGTGAVKAAQEKKDGGKNAKTITLSTGKVVTIK